MILIRRASIILPFLFAAIIVFSLSLGVLHQADPLRTFPSLDSGYYLYIGQQILQGKTPYLDFWESKPPGIFYINALGLLLGRGTRWGVWAVEFVFLLASAGLGFYVIQRRYGFFPALFGTVAWLWGIQGVLQGGNLTEEYSLPFNFAAILFFALAIQSSEKRLYPLLIGITFAFSFLLRANNAGVQVALVLAWVLYALLHSEFRLLLFRLFWSGLGVALILGLTGLFLLWQGSLGEAIDAALIFNFYMSSGGGANLLSGLVLGFRFIGIPAGFGLLGYLLLAVLSTKRELWTLFLLLLFPLEVILSSLSGRGYPHYYITWMPALAILSAHLLAGLSALCVALDARRVWVSLGALVACLILLAVPLTETASSLRQVATNRQDGVEMDAPLAAYLRQNTGPEDSVLVWGGRLAYNYLSRRESPSSVLFYPLLVESPISARLSERFLEEITTNPPVMIVDTHAINQDLLPALDPEIRREQEAGGKLWGSLPENISLFYAFVSQNYELEAEIRGAQLYRRVVP